jgi:chromosome segregation ATPase
LILEAEDSLSQLEEALDQGDLEAAGPLLGQTNGTLGKLTAALKTLSKPKKKEKMQQFINQTKHRVQQLETKMLRILAKYNLTEEDEEAIKAEFQAMINGLDDVDVDRDDLGDTVDKLKKLVKDTNSIGKGKGVDEDLVDDINKLNKHESKLNRYRERIRMLEGFGAPTDELLGLLNQTESLLSQADDEIAAGNKEVAEDLIDEADEILDTIDDMIDDLEEEYEEDDDDEADDDDDGKTNNGKGKDKEKPSDDEDENDDFEKEKQKLMEEIAELDEKIAELGEEGEDISEIEAELEEIKSALDQAEDEEDFEELEEQLDELEDRIEDLEDSSPDDDDEEHDEHEPDEGDSETG